MTLDRRDFARLFVTSAAAGLALPRDLLGLAGLPGHGRDPFSRQDTFFDWRAVGDRVHVAFGQGGNVLLLRDGGRALISDSKNFGFGYTLRREAESFGASLEYAIATHHHGDHVGGLSAFRPDIPVFAHGTARDRIRTWAEGVAGQESEALARTLQQLREQGASDAAVGDVERLAEDVRGFAVERLVPSGETGTEREYRVGNRTVEVRHIGSGHTDNDVFLYLPEENVIHSGDLCFNGSHGFMDQNGGVSSEGWQRSVVAMLEIADGETVVVPGHGEITDRTGLERQHAYFGQLRDAVSAAVQQGRSKEEVMELQPAALADVQGNPARNLGVMYDEVTGG